MIEDVQYLQEHSLKESYIFFVDSKDRDYTLYPTPQSYRINFSAPFKHVYSLEILDASIPRTQYCVDTHNNTLRLCIFSKNDDVKHTWYELVLPIRDYNDVTLISTLNNLFSSNGIEITVKNQSLPADELSTFVFESRSEFHFDMNNSTLFRTLGFDLHASLNDSEKYITLDTFLNEFDSDDMVQSYLSSLIKNDQMIQNVSYYKQRWYGSVGGNQIIDESFSSNSSEINESVPTTNSIHQSFVSNFSGNLYSLIIDIYEETQLKQFMFQIRNSSNSVLAYGIYLVDENVYNFTSLVYLTQGELYSLVLYQGKNIDGLAVSIDINVNTKDEQKATLNVPISFNISSEPGTPLPYSLCFQVNVKNLLQQIVAPGIYNLIGDRYILLKCKEIEDHLFRSRAYEKFTMGLAKFKLAVMGYDESRFDFASTPPREFHPIGKLTNLTFNFQRPDGSLYNFRGINHTLTIVIRYYEPSQNIKFEKSSLNPSYDPDTFRYIQNKEYYTDSEQSVSDED